MKKIYFLLLASLLAGLPLAGQVCQGNLGDNIFTEGDFGSGEPNVVLTNPNIAPGYMYTTDMPPNDGYYTITNDISQWPSAFGWAEISDNSPNPNGYMMIVNASYDPGLFYIQEVNDLCEDTRYEFSADIYNLINQGGNAIKPNVTFAINGLPVFSTGDIPENNNWNNYGFSFVTDPGQTSVVLSLNNNAPGGGGNDLALDNITFRACGDEALILPLEVANICEDGSPVELTATVIGDIYDTPAFQWQQSFDEGNTWVDIDGAIDPQYSHTNLSAGTYYYRYLLANGPLNILNNKCRVRSNVKIVQVLPKFIEFVDTICEGQFYSFNDSDIGSSGVYVDSLLNFLGCDSIVSLDLTVVLDPGIDVVFYNVNPSCLGIADGAIRVENIYNGVAPFTMTVDGISVDDLRVMNLPDGVYDIVINDYFGCAYKTKQTLTVPNPLLLDIGEDQSVLLGEEIKVSATANQNIVNYFWEPAISPDCAMNCDQLVWTPPVTSEVSLTVEDEYGCFAKDSLLVYVEEVRNVYIPNAFSPNNDGVNDHFTIMAEQPNVLSIESLLIFDRWGSVVFKNENFLPNVGENGWDGKRMGKKANSGVYVYSARIKFLDGRVIPYAGSLVLMD